MEFGSLRRAFASQGTPRESSQIFPKSIIWHQGSMYIEDLIGDVNNVETSFLSVKQNWTVAVE